MHYKFHNFNKYPLKLLLNTLLILYISISPLFFLTKRHVLKKIIIIINKVTFCLIWFDVKQLRPFQRWLFCFFIIELALSDSHLFSVNLQSNCYHTSNPMVLLYSWEFFLRHAHSNFHFLHLTPRAWGKARNKMFLLFVIL